MSSQYFSPYVIGESSNVIVVLDLSGYAREDNMDYFKGKDPSEKYYLMFVPMNKYLNKRSNTENIS